MAVICHFHVHLLPSNKGRYYLIKEKGFLDQFAVYNIPKLAISSCISPRCSSRHFHTCILFCLFNIMWFYIQRYSTASEMWVADLRCGKKGRQIGRMLKGLHQFYCRLTGFMCESGFVFFPTLCACLYALSGVAMMQIVSCPYVKTISPTKNGNSLPIMAC